MYLTSLNRAMIALLGGIVCVCVREMSEIGVLHCLTRVDIICSSASNIVECFHETGVWPFMVSENHKNLKQIWCKKLSLVWYQMFSSTLGLYEQMKCAMTQGRVFFVLIELREIKIGHLWHQLVWRFWLVNLHGEIMAVHFQSVQWRKKTIFCCDNQIRVNQLSVKAWPRWVDQKFVQK